MNRTTLLQKLTSWPGATALCLLIVVGTLCVKLWPRTVPFEQCSEIYQKYAHTPGIDAAFVKDYRINDTVTIDATVLEATTDSAWAMLQNDFNVPIIPDEYKELLDNSKSISLRLAPKNNPKAPMDSILLNNDMITISRKMQTIQVFHVTSALQIASIFNKKTDELKYQEYEN